MKKLYYDHKCVMCPECGWYRPAGKRPGSRIDPEKEWPEACECYGYLLNPDRYPELADDCEGFKSPQYVRDLYSKQQKKNKK